MAEVKALVRGGITICATIHSPTPFAFALFDALIILLRGRVVYFGDRGARPCAPGHIARCRAFWRENVLCPVLREAYECPCVCLRGEILYQPPSQPRRLAGRGRCVLSDAIPAVSALTA